MIPYIVQVLGIENYGIYGLLNAFVAPMGLIGLGTAPAIIRGVASHRDDRLSNMVQMYVQVGLALSLVIGIIGGLFIVAVGPPIFLKFFSKSSIAVTDLYKCFLLVGIQWLCNQINGTWSAAVAGLQEYRFTAIGQTTQNILLTGFGVFALWLGFGLVGYVFASTLTSILMIIYWMGAVARLIGKHALLPAFEPKIAKLTISFGAWFSLAQIGKLLGADSQRYIVGLILGASSVGIFNIAHRIMSTLYGINGKILEVLFPHFSSQTSLPTEIKLRNLLITTGGCSLFSVSTLSPLVAIACPILSLWISPQVGSHGYVLLQLLCLGGLFISVSGPVYFFLLSEGKSRITATIALFVGVTMTLVSLLVTPKFGLVGLGIAFTTAGIMYFILYATALYHLSKGSSCNLMKSYLVYSLVPIATSALIYYIASSNIHASSWLSIVIIYSALSLSSLFLGCLSLQMLDYILNIKLNPLKIVKNNLMGFAIPYINSSWKFFKHFNG